MAGGNEHLSVWSTRMHSFNRLDNKTTIQNRLSSFVMSKICYGLHTMLVSTMQHFDCWQQVVNTMIEKEPGNPSLHCLGVIHLYENDYNLILGTKYCQVIQTHLCQDRSQLNPGCYGCLFNKKSHDPIFLEVMQYDDAVLTRWDTI